MAAAEARALWQRTANRCFVQEDAKRAPKLACCQSSAASTEQANPGRTGAADTPDHSSGSFMPVNQNPLYTNLPPDTRWWLQMRPEYDYPKGFTHEKSKTSEAEMEVHSENKEIPFNMDSVEPKFCEFNDPKESEAFRCENIQEFVDLMETRENYGFLGLDMDPSGYTGSKKPDKLSFDPDSPWMSNKKSEPWWRMTDRDELASFVSQRSLDFIENCDLPTPQKIHTRRYPCSNSWRSGELTPFNRKPSGTGCISSPIPVFHGRSFSDSIGALRHQKASMEMRYGFDKSSSTKDSSASQSPESNLSKAELLEALRHSQTRAREAEKAAKEVLAEKDHITKLFFKQASQLFAYKQWFQLLRLEVLYFQVRNNVHPASCVLLDAIPWRPRRVRKGKMVKRGRARRPDIAKYCMAFALGLSLVGAGLLLGWTVGWMLPF